MIFKPNKNGSLVIPKWFLLVIVILFSIIGATVTAATSYSTLRSDVNSLEENMKVISEWDKKWDNIHISCARDDERLKSMEQDISEIKEILNKQRS